MTVFHGLVFEYVYKDSDEDPLPKQSRQRSSKRKSRKFDSGLNKYNAHYAFNVIC